MSHLRFNQHVDSCVKKDSKSIYCLIELRRGGCSEVILVRYYYTVMRCILTYRYAVFHNLPSSLFTQFEFIEIRFIKITGAKFPLPLANLGHQHCLSLFDQISFNQQHPLQILFKRRSESFFKEQHIASC